MLHRDRRIEEEGPVSRRESCAVQCPSSLKLQVTGPARDSSA